MRGTDYVLPPEGRVARHRSNTNTNRSNRITHHQPKGNTMTPSSSTRPVPSGNGYTAPETSQSRMAAELRRGLQKVDGNGFPVATRAETGVTQVTDGTDPATATVPATPSPRTPTGGSREPVAAPGAPGSLLERLQAKAAQQLAEPLPPGSTTV
jgi:hypothetical protein